MDGKTHVAVGVASTAIVLYHTQFNVIDWGMALGVAVVGATLPDVDVVNGRKSWDRVKYLVLFCAAYVVQMLMSHTDMLQRVIGMALFFGLYLLGSQQPHRGFTHSIAAWAMFTTSVYLAFKGVSFALWIILGFSVSYASHLAIDVLNRKGCQYLWPLPKRWCLKICTADGIVSKIVMWISYITAGCIIAVSVATSLGATF